MCEFPANLSSNIVTGNHGTTFINGQRSLRTPAKIPRPPSAHNTPTPLRAVHLHRTPHSESNATVSKQRRIGAGVNAKIEIEVRSVLVRARKTGLRAERVSLRRAQVGDHDDDAVACVADSAAGAVGLDGEFPACAAAGTGTGALWFVLLE